jgi:hypothetical protein
VTTIRFRRGTEAQWLLRDPVLDPGEPALSLDVRLLKVGDGVKRWSELVYLTATGVPGPQGEPGANGTNGVDGRSAYELAVISGFVGTQAEWLASLKGDTGLTGPKGDTGNMGLTGPKGDTGDTGATGPKGDKGDTGNTGPAGADGASYTGPKITESTTAPSSPAAGDVWIDTST